MLRQHRQTNQPIAEAVRRAMKDVNLQEMADCLSLKYPTFAGYVNAHAPIPAWVVVDVARITRDGYPLEVMEAFTMSLTGGGDIGDVLDAISHVQGATSTAIRAAINSLADDERIDDEEAAEIRAALLQARAAVNRLLGAIDGYNRGGVNHGIIERTRSSSGTGARRRTLAATSEYAATRA